MSLSLNTRAASQHFIYLSKTNTHATEHTTFGAAINNNILIKFSQGAGIGANAALSAKQRYRQRGPPVDPGTHEDVSSGGRLTSGLPLALGSTSDAPHDTFGFEIVIKKVKFALQSFSRITQFSRVVLFPD